MSAFDPLRTLQWDMLSPCLFNLGHGLIGTVLTILKDVTIRAGNVSFFTKCDAMNPTIGEDRREICTSS